MRCIVIPGTQQVVHATALKEGLIEIFIDAGCDLHHADLRPVSGRLSCGVLAAGERAVSTTNRNFVGRMGHIDSEVIPGQLRLSPRLPPSRAASATPEEVHVT